VGRSRTGSISFSRFQAPGVDEVGGEDAAVEKIVVIGFERVEDFGERSGGLPDAAVLLRR
jgi:hypothetical protein